NEASQTCHVRQLRAMVPSRGDLVLRANQQRLQIETTHDSVGRTFQLTIMDSDGTPQVESFKSKKAFEARLRQLEAELIADAWTPSGSALLPRSPASLH